MTKDFVYATYIRTTPEKLWNALTNSEFMKQYWFGTYCDSGWKAGSPWKMVRPDGQISDDGEIIESIPPRRLVIKWRHARQPELKAEGYSRCTFEIERIENAVKLTVTHSMEQEGTKFIEAVSGGWPKILSNLKSLIETGQVVLGENVGCKAVEAEAIKA